MCWPVGLAKKLFEPVPGKGGPLVCCPFLQLKTCEPSPTASLPLSCAGATCSAPFSLSICVSLLCFARGKRKWQSNPATFVLSAGLGAERFPLCPRTIGAPDCCGGHAYATDEQTHTSQAKSCSGLLSLVIKPLSDAGTTRAFPDSKSRLSFKF